MHHLYPLAKGDNLCPLGFHPQVRWPTRCKRCFRDYKEHGGRKREDDFTASTPSLSTYSPASRSRDGDNGGEGERSSRGWSSSVNLSFNESAKNDISGTKTTTWTSTPDLANDTESATAITVNLKLPKRRSTGPLPSLDTGQGNESVTVRRPSPSPPPSQPSAQITINKNDSLAERVRKMQLMKAQSSFEKESSSEKDRERRSASRSKEEEKITRVKDDKPSLKDDVNFMMQVKSSRNNALSKPPKRGGPSRDREETSDDEHSLAGTTTTDTETTLIDANVKEYQEQVESLKQEVDILRKRCERVEKEKSDILLRRLANIDTVNKYSIGRSSEVLKLQQKVNELTTQNEDLKDEKKHLTLKIKEVETELEGKPSVEAQTKQIEQLRAKLLAAETLCEELMDENEDMKKELRDLEEEIEEMQDNFREDQADEYTSLRRELEQTIKNCRVLSFKLKKTERRNEQLEQEKTDQEKKLLEIVGGKQGMERENRIKELEQEVSRANEVALRLQRELAEANTKLAAASGAPPANLKTHAPSEGKKVSRSSLTRGGSQEDPAQLLRDLQDSLEREADLREQLRNAEEEGYVDHRGFEDNMSELKSASLSLHHQTSNRTANNTDNTNNSSRKPFHFQLQIQKETECFNLEKILFIGVNRESQCPQDIALSYAEGCQTDLIMVCDVASETRKTTLDSSSQCDNDMLDTSTQTNESISKHSSLQTYCQNIITQPKKSKVNSSGTQDMQGKANERNVNTLNITDPVNKGSTQSEGTQTEHPINGREKSDSPPLSSEKPLALTSGQIHFPLALFNPLAARLPIANNLRKTASRVEDDNESLLLQLKKMATKARSRKLSPTAPTNRLAIEAPNEKDEGISDEEDPAELRLLLELNEQEAAVLRKKVEDLEQDKETLKKQVKELSEKVSNAATKTNANTGAALRRTSNKGSLAEEKVKVLEDEIAELRKKLIEKERDCERLHAELSIVQKKPKASLIKSKSLDGDQQNVDLKRQLQVIEQEANVLRTKTQNLEVDNEKLQAENKRLQLLKGTKSLKSDKTLEITTNKASQLEKELREALTKIKDLETTKDDKNEKKVRFSTEISKKESDSLKIKQEELDKLKLNFNKLEKEKLKLQTTLKELKEDALKSFKPRTPKKVTDLTTKLQLKKMVEDLESEIGELYVVMKNSGMSALDNKTVTKEMEEVKEKLSKQEAEFTNERNRLQSEISRLKDLNLKIESEKISLLEKIKSLETDRNSSVTECKSLKDEKKTLDLQINKLTSDLKKSSTQHTAVSDCMKKIEDLKKEIDVKDKDIEKLKKQVETFNKLEQDKNKLLKEVGDKTKKIGELEKKLKDAEDKCKRTEKLLATRKDRVSKLEKEEEALRDTSNQKYDEAVSSVEIAQIKEKYEKTATQLKEKEEQLRAAKDEFTKVEKEFNTVKNEISQLKSTVNKCENDKKDLEEKIKAEQKDSKYWESKTSEIELDLQAERKKLERMRSAHDKDIKNKEAELATLKGKLKVLEQTSGAGAKRIAELKQEHEENMKKLEHTLAVEKAEYEELTSKYELLEEEHVVTKARLTVDKEQAQGELLHCQKELSDALAELKSLQESLSSQTSSWKSEKTQLQKEISSLQERLCGGGWEVEKARLNTKLDKQERELRDQIQKNEVLVHHHDLAKKELEEAKRKLEDYERVSKVHRTLTADNAELERELATLNSRLEQTEKARKNEINDTKSRYEEQMNTMREELKSLHNQVSRFKRERDNYKQMLESTQKTMSEMKNGNKTKAPRTSISSTDDEEFRNKVATLEQQVACLEDELCEARLLSSKLNTELISERSSAEVRLAEMQSRLNEYEEDRLLSSGRARVAGLATRMELAWHKERDEQQRLLQETSTLARDLRQTLFELEREREKERLDMKRRMDQIKRTTEEETEEAKKKVTELQCDLLELRDAHAKLRTANEKLRRDKERHDRDRDQNKLLIGSLKRAQQEDDRVVTHLLETIDELIKQSPELFRTETGIKPEKSLATPTPPRRNRSSKSRSRSATPEQALAETPMATGQRLRRLADELRASRIAERQRRQLTTSSRRAMSTEPRDTMTVTSASRTPSRVPSLKKRSISLEQTTKDQSSIWKTVEDSSVSSMQSLDGDDRLFTMQRDTSLDSRLSGGSAQSEVLASEKKKKKSIFGKLKKLTKSRSIDDNVEEVEFKPIGNVSQQGSDSDMSATGSKQNLRGRLSDMFSRKGHLSRGNSKEQSPDTGSASGSRSILRNASSSTLPRSTTLSATTDTQSTRAASATPGTKRKGK
ncbi:unnamed protein product [Leptosia nina]|uniref:Uncharacterized protein n=1 Tax=Leptosia nina TaxID=320188 RepID=A0AAV1J7M6_9NEOP